jgi:hypothetical protein
MLIEPNNYRVVQAASLNQRRMPEPAKMQAIFYWTPLLKKIKLQFVRESHTIRSHEGKPRGNRRGYRQES